MARKQRVVVPKAVYHLTSRGNRRHDIFLGRADKERFLQMLGAVVARRRWKCHAYCLMPNHFHVVLETDEADLSRGIQWLTGVYAQSFNRRHDLGGHLFQGRFHSVLVESDWHLLELARYLPLNPVRAGLCRRAEDWGWSSFRAVVGLDRLPPFLTSEDTLSLFGRDPDSARRAFARFVSEG